MSQKDKATSQPLPAARGVERRAAELRGNLLKRKQQARARAADTDDKNDKQKET